jgi:hypothetical protein
VNLLGLSGPPSIYLEFAQSELRLLSGERTAEWSLERQPNGRLTAECRQKLQETLAGFLNRKKWQPNPVALCAIDGRGVSLRRLALPHATGEEFQRLLLLQLEGEFPLPPEQLAWGYCRVNGNSQPVPPGSGPASNNSTQYLMVAAIKKEVIEEYHQLVQESGANPVFTLSAIARNRLCPRAPGAYAILNVEGDYSELACFEAGAPSMIRLLPWGESDKEKKGPLDASRAASLETLKKVAGGNGASAPLYICGSNGHLTSLVSELENKLGAVRCELLPPGTRGECSSALQGLERFAKEDGGLPPLLLQSKPATTSISLREPTVRKWAQIAAALLLLLCIWPYGEAFLLKPILARKLTALKADNGRLSTIDRELEFLQFMKQSQPPYLDALFVFSKAAPQGTHLDSLSLNHKGEISLRGSVRDAQQVVDFRSKLVESKFFSSVSVEEQSPTPDHQKVNFRLSAQWKSADSRASLSIGPTAEEIERAKTNQPAGGGIGMPMPGGPPGFMLSP